jgi:hypothetical protein
MKRDCPKFWCPRPLQLVRLWQQWYMEFQFLTPKHNSNANKPYLWLHFTILRLIVMCILPLSHVFCFCFIILLCLMPEDLNSWVFGSTYTSFDLSNWNASYKSERKYKLIYSGFPWSRWLRNKTIDTSTHIW